MDADRSSILPDTVDRSYAMRLGVALSLAVLVVVAFGGLISMQATAELTADSRDEVATTAATQADRLDDWLDGTRRDVRRTAAHPTLAGGSVDEVDAYLDDLVASGDVPEDVVAVHMVNTETMEIEASSSEQLTGVNARDQGAPFATDPPTFDGPGDTHVTRPFTVPIVDHPIVAVVSPVPGEDRLVVYMTDLSARAESIAGTTGETTTLVVDDEGRYVAHPNASRILATSPRWESVGNGFDSGDTNVTTGDSAIFGVARLETHDWTVITRVEKSSALGLAGQINSDLVGLVFLAIINLALVGVTIGSNTVVSLRRLSERAEAIGDGNLDADLETTRNDEIGRLYGSIDRMRTNLRESLADAEDAKERAEDARERAEQRQAESERMNDHLEAKADEYSDVLSAAAAGDLTGRVDTDSENEAMASVGEAINETIDSLEETIADTKSFADQVVRATERVGDDAGRVDDASDEVSRAIDEIFEGTNEQSQRLQDAADEMEQLSATAEEVAASAQQVATTSDDAAAVGQEGSDAAQRAIEQMNEIEADTEETVAEINALDDELDEIGEIVRVITDIVEQTNMLALNASVEAARADAGGEGFAVVADEIKSLAEETKDAAGDIEERIESIQSQASDTVDTMETTSERITDGLSTVEEAVEALERLVEYSDEVDAGIQEIDDATEEQARAATQVMETIDELSSISQQTAQQADTVANAADDQSDSITRVADSARELRSQADELQQLLRRFDVEGDREEVGAD